VNRRNLLKTLGGYTTAITVAPKNIAPPKKDNFKLLKKYNKLASKINNNIDNKLTRRLFLKESTKSLFSDKTMFLSDYAEFALPKSYLQNGIPKYRGVTRRLHVRKLYGGNTLSKVAPSTSLIQTTKPTTIPKKINPLKLKRRWF
jgi:hypothetical protein